MSNSAFYGYPGRIWAIVFAALQQLQQALSTASDPFNTLPLAASVADTLLNGVAAINANRITQIWSAETATMRGVAALPITINPADAVYFNARLAAMTAATNAIAALVPVPNPTTVATLLNQGLPAIPDPGLLEFFEAFAFETPPAGLTIGNLPALAALDAVAFNNIAMVVFASEGGSAGGTLDYLYDLPNRFSQEMSSYATLLGEFIGFTSSNMTTFWNQMFTLPTMLLHADRLSSAPNNIIAQQDQLIRFLICNALKKLNVFILSVDRPVAQQVQQAAIMVGDNLMDVAARSLGNFEQWVDIATLNNLQAPFVGATSSPGVAGWGSRVLLPTINGPQPSGVTPDYLLNFLGVDIYFGPINGDMPPWSGDFQLISGYNNLRWALGRRMQTTLGSLIYHRDYGCRIPPEVGNVQTAATAGYITAFGVSCLKSDPRVGSVLQASTSVGQNFSLQFSGEIQPKGFGTTTVNVNEVINASISPAGR